MKRQAVPGTIWWIFLAIMAIELVGCQSGPVSDTVETVPPAASPAAPTQQEPSPPPPAPTTAVPAFEPADCQFAYDAEPAVRCGFLTVPENRANPGRMIQLHVAIVASRSPTPAPDPVVYLSGGPGGHALAAAEYFATIFDEILATRDLILFDQRGVGFSRPALECPETEEARLAHIEEYLQPEEEEAIFLEALAACRDRLTAEGIDLSAYHSAASAADLDDLRRALGYDRWNLLGISYGTRLALTAMRDFGQTGTIRSAVLAAVYPPQIDTLVEAGLNTDRAFDLLFARCAADAACAAAYPDLESRFYALVEALNREPTSVTVTDRLNRTTFRVPFDGDDLIYTFFGMMYAAGEIKYLPRRVAHLEQNRKTDLMDWLTDNLHPFNSLGMGLSVHCIEEFPFNRPADVEAAVEPLPSPLAQLGREAAAGQAARCRVWQVAPADPLENEPVVSDIPTLLLAGDFDPVTPPAFAERTAAHLTRAFYFELPGQSHDVIGATDCGMELVTAFLDRPDTPPAAGCLQRLFFGFVTD